MAGGGAWSRRVAGRARTLRGLVRDTQRALHDVADILHYDPEILTAVQEIGQLSSRLTALVVLGTTAEARARLLHCLLGRRLLPDRPPIGCRWLRIQYGATTQVHLTLGNSEFELVEDLECNKRPWETLPIQDLVRQDHTDLATMLEIELNNPFLKDGLRIIVPPDIDHDTCHNLQTLKHLHSELYSKRDLILKNFNPVYLYAVDRIGKNVFSDSFVSNMVTSRSEEDFWSSFNLYNMTRSSCDSGENGEGGESDKSEVVEERPWKGGGEPAVFTSENCLDLHQVKDINPHSQVLFVLFSDSRDIREGNRMEDRVRVCIEATESTEDAVYSAEELPESDQELIRHSEESPRPKKKSTDSRRLNEEQNAFMNDLLDQWELMSNPTPKHYVKSQSLIIDDSEILRTSEQRPLAPPIANAILNADSRSKRDGESDRIVKSRTALLNNTVKFATDCLQSYLLEYCTRLSENHVKLLQQFILASFDMARELQVVPKKIQYVATQEQQLYETINEKFSDGDKKQELLQIMQEVLQEMRAEVNNMDWSVDDLPCHQDRRFVISNSVFYSWSPTSPGRVRLTEPADAATSASASDGEEAVSCDSYNFEDYEIIQETDESLSVSESFRKSKQDDSSPVSSQIGSIRIENESSSWGSPRWSAGAVCNNDSNMSLKQASLDVQQTVLSKLSRKISLKLVKFVDCLKDTYFGTLQRCLDSLESSCRQELGGRPASEAMRQLLSVARQVDLQPCASFSLLRSMLDSLRRLFSRLRIVGSEGEEACCVLSPVWRRQVALHTAHSLGPQRLARVISAQILERLSDAHERYQSALTSLESALANRLHHTEDIKLAIRKKYAPSFARLCLESTSMCDLLMYGTPELGREIGRGQYGVVYAVRGGWGGRSPAAVKSVLPADERHYHELAMEFFYTR
ncbi:dual serine/threonine and tyrosine protein kinase-like isoform X3 [Ostrinia furnacalis]|nr:dual serine/threonine and tyrosine protein kinase-like isoform X3 [Ostrinia furnacalis]